MKRMILMAALALAVPLAACNTTLGTAASEIAGTATTPVCNRTVLDDKARYGVEALYNVPAQAYVSAVQHGLVTASVKAAVKPKLQTLYSYLKGARAAHAACDEATFLNYQSAMERVKNEVLPLIPR